MNIISYDVELTKSNKAKEEILVLIKTCLAKYYKTDLENREVVERTWDKLPYQEFITVNSSKHLLYSFTFENVQVFLFKKETADIVALNDLSVNVLAISSKEMNLILKSSFTKLKSVFSKGLSLRIIEGTHVNLYPFDYDKNDVVSPTFYLKANYTKDLVAIETREWIKLIIFIVITCVFVVMYFTTPSEVVDPITKLTTSNNVKEVYSAFMSVGIGFVIIEVITKLLVPKICKRSYPLAIISNFSNIFENNSSREITKPVNPTDPNLS